MVFQGFCSDKELAKRPGFITKTFIKDQDLL